MLDSRIKPELKVAGSWCWERLLYYVYRYFIGLYIWYDNKLK
jgi:hypothetical protein